MKLKVTTFCINKGQPSQFFGLKTVKNGGWVLFSAPNNWKTEAGALHWAVKHGYEI